MDYFAQFKGFIVTAQDGGSISLNAKVVGEMFNQDKHLVTQLVAQANLAKELEEALTKLGIEAPTIKDALVRYERAMDVAF